VDGTDVDAQGERRVFFDCNRRHGPNGAGSRPAPAESPAFWRRYAFQADAPCAAAFDRKIVVRIAFLALHFAEYSGRLALALAARHDVMLVLNSRNARDELTDDLRAQLERSLTLRYVELPRLRNPRLLLSNWATVRMLRDFSPDVLHMQEVHPAHAGLPLLWFRRRIPVVMTIHDSAPHSGGLPKDHWLWRIVLWFRAKASRYIIHGPRVQAEVHEMDRRIEGRSDIIPHWTPATSCAAGATRSAWS
jgi:hypothetical protein